MRQSRRRYKKAMKRICFISQFPPPVHGLSVAVKTLYDNIDKHKFTVEKINIAKNRNFLFNALKIIVSKADLYYFTISQSLPGNLRDLIILFLLRRKRFVIHLHGGGFYSLLCKVSPLRRKLNYKYINNAAGVVVLSESLKFNFDKIVPEDKIFVVGNGIDSLFSYNSLDEKLENIKRKEITDVLYLSNFIEAKGYKRILEIALLEKRNILRGNTQKFRFHFAGMFYKNVHKKEFFKFIEDNDLSDVVVFHGEVSGEEKKILFNKCDIFMLLTRYEKEGQPISIIEAMSCALTVIAANFKGIPELVQCGENGILVDDNSDEEIYDMILNLSAEQLVKFSRNNFYKSKKYTKENYVTGMEKIFSLCTDK